MVMMTNPVLSIGWPGRLTSQVSGKTWGIRSKYSGAGSELAKPP
jgi:hypothetical protein